MQASELNGNICHCCGMPLDEESISKENPNYCKWCYEDGKVVYTDIDELIEKCIPFMVEQGFNEEQAREYMKNTLPNLPYWKERK